MDITNTQSSEYVCYLALFSLVHISNITRTLDHTLTRRSPTPRLSLWTQRAGKHADSMSVFGTFPKKLQAILTSYISSTLPAVSLTGPAASSTSLAAGFGLPTTTRSMTIGSGLSTSMLTSPTRTIVRPPSTSTLLSVSSPPRTTMVVVTIRSFFP
jgi:hypothetical protein